jgi:hypothetical protein
VEYQRIGGPVWSVGCEYGAFFSSGEGVRGKRAGGLRGLLFGTLLGFEATGPVLVGRCLVVSVFLHVRVRGRVPWCLCRGAGSGSGV